MTLWLDAHLDPDLAPWLGSRFKVIAKTVKEVGLRDADDLVLFEAAKRLHTSAIMTKDSDFADLVKRLGAPPHIILLTCGNISTLELQVILSKRFAEALELIGGGQALVEIAAV